jgi:hypothetical protein
MNLDWWRALGFRVKYNPAITPPFKGEILKLYVLSLGRFNNESWAVKLRKFPRAAPARTCDGKCA